MTTSTSQHHKLVNHLLTIRLRELADTTPEDQRASETLARSNAERAYRLLEVLAGRCPNCARRVSKWGGITPGWIEVTCPRSHCAAWIEPAPGVDLWHGGAKVPGVDVTRMEAEELLESLMPCSIGCRCGSPCSWIDGAAAAVRGRYMVPACLRCAWAGRSQPRPIRPLAEFLALEVTTTRPARKKARSA
jgi:hypothetical protein